MEGHTNRFVLGGRAGTPRTLRTPGPPCPARRQAAQFGGIGGKSWSWSGWRGPPIMPPSVLPTCAERISPMPLATVAGPRARPERPRPVLSEYLDEYSLPNRAESCCRSVGCLQSCAGRSRWRRWWMGRWWRRRLGWRPIWRRLGRRRWGRWQPEQRSVPRRLCRSPRRQRRSSVSLYPALGGSGAAIGRRHASGGRSDVPAAIRARWTFGRARWRAW